MRNLEDSQDRPRRPKTRTVEPPKPERSEQVPAGDDSDITQGQEPPQNATSEDESKTEKQSESIDPEPQGGEDSGCAC